jgi:superfamily I DNA/RNA helicase
MAKMFPDRLPDDVKSPAERLLYKEFEKQLSDDFAVFHEVSWQVDALGNGAQDGEIDFVIACPQLGILVLEVKGGQICCNGTTGKWFSNNKSIKDPFKQACNNKYNMLGWLKEFDYWHQRWIPIGHAVALPDVEVNGWLPPHAPHKIILDHTQLKNLSGWVTDVLDYYRHQDKCQGEFDAISIKELENCISPSIDLKPLLGSTIEQEKQELIRLTEQQFRLLDFLGRRRRVAISGCAGSGKTLLAVEKACRLNEQGFSVLLTCFNKGLAESLKKAIGKKKNLHVYNFHALCNMLAIKAGFDLNPYQKYEYDKNLLFNEIYPKLLEDAANKLNWRVDAVIVDEGQDLGEKSWQALKSLLNDPEDGIFYYFYDDNQNIFDHHWKPPLEEAPFTLTENWRNTKQIHSYVLQFYKGQNSTIALGAEGYPVEIQDYTTNSQLKNLLSGLLHRLVVKEKVAAKDIVILTTRKMPLLENKLIGDFLVKAKPDYKNKEIECHTIHHFKGLERPVVILIETDLRSVSYLKNLLYVGASRARQHLIIFKPDAPF